jgi:ribosomal protein S14
MAKVAITNPVPRKGRVIHGVDGVARRRCRICGRTVYGRNAGICRECLAHITRKGDGRARRRCRICGRAVYGRNAAGICLDCIAAQICLHAKDGKAVGQ